MYFITRSSDPLHHATQVARGWFTSSKNTVYEMYVLRARLILCVHCVLVNLSVFPNRFLTPAVPNLYQTLGTMGLNFVHSTAERLFLSYLSQ